MTGRAATGFAFGLTALVSLALAGLALAQTSGTLSARLGWVPISLAQQSEVSGQGRVTASLAGSRLSIAGTFDGLPAAASAARLHRGVATGAGGPAIADLEVSRGTSGELSGDVELDRDQRAALLAGHLYVQLYAERGVPPDNAVLRGWLLADAEDRSRERRPAR
jgi:hypothetical protein